MVSREVNRVVSIFIAVLSFFVGLFIFQAGDNPIVMPVHQGSFI